MISYLIFMLKGSIPVKVAVVAWMLFTTLAVTEAFYGQIIVAFLASIPSVLTAIGTLIVLRRGQKVTQENQKEMAKSMDGKLAELIQAKTAVAHAAGAKEERTEERARVREDVAPALPAQIEIINASDNPVPVKPIEEKK